MAIKIVMAVVGLWALAVVVLVAVLVALVLVVMDIIASFGFAVAVVAVTVVAATVVADAVIHCVGICFFRSWYSLLPLRLKTALPTLLPIYCSYAGLARPL